MHACLHARLPQLCLTLCDPMDCSLPSSSVHRLLQARILEWVAMPSSRESFWPRDRTQTQGSNPRLLWLLHCKQILYCWAMGEGNNLIENLLVRIKATMKEWMNRRQCLPKLPPHQIVWTLSFKGLPQQVSFLCHPLTFHGSRAESWEISD